MPKASFYSNLQIPSAKADGNKYETETETEILIAVHFSERICGIQKIKGF